ncbi:hypothetical protein HW132_34840 [Brasilonema sp. CT11]|nr:hypothetical protein [Brasilonema sp. CT11]
MFSANPEGFNVLGLAVSRASTNVIQLLLTNPKIDDAGAFIGNFITQDVSGDLIIIVGIV